MKKRLSALALTLVLALSLAVPASAYGMGKVGAYTTLSSGRDHTAVIDENGSLWMWGNNTNGQIHTDSLEDLFYLRHPKFPVPVKVMDDVASVSCGRRYTAVIKTDGSLWMWGYNIYGQLGQSDLPSYLPTKVLDNVAAVSCGETHTAAIKSDGSLWIWGSNSSGQLGNGTKNMYSVTPMKVMDNVAAVSCGSKYTAAIKTDGTLWTWGENGSGQLGNGTTEDSAVPVKVMDGVASVSCGSDRTAAVQTDGTLWMWGLVSSGITQNKPVQVLSGVSSCCLAPNILDPVVFKSDGSLWGTSSDQPAGAQTFTDLFSFSKILDGVAAVVACDGYEIMMQMDGTILIWTDSERVDELLASGMGEIDNSFSEISPAVRLTSLTAKLPSTMAYASTQSILVDGKAVEFQMYALKDEEGNSTNYVKLRDVAQILNGTAAQFAVGWDGAVNILTGQPYTPDGSEMSTPFSGNRVYTIPTAQTKVNGSAVQLDAIVLTDGSGGGFTYYKLRDLGAALGFTVDWSADKGIFIETDKPGI